MGWVQGCTSLSQHSGRQRQAFLCKFEDSPAYKNVSRTARPTQRNSVSKKQNKTKTKTKKEICLSCSRLQLQERDLSRLSKECGVFLFVYCLLACLV